MKEFWYVFIGVLSYKHKEPPPIKDRTHIFKLIFINKVIYLLHLPSTLQFLKNCVVINRVLIGEGNLPIFLHDYLFKNVLGKWDCFLQFWNYQIGKQFCLPIFLTFIFMRKILWIAISIVLCWCIASTYAATTTVNKKMVWSSKQKITTVSWEASFWKLPKKETSVVQKDSNINSWMTMSWKTTTLIGRAHVWTPVRRVLFRLKVIL